MLLLGLRAAAAVGGSLLLLSPSSSSSGGSIGSCACSGGASSICACRSGAPGLHDESGLGGVSVDCSTTNRAKIANSIPKILPRQVVEAC